MFSLLTQPIPVQPLRYCVLSFAIASTQSTDRRHPSRSSHRPSPRSNPRYHSPRYTTLDTRPSTQQSPLTDTAPSTQLPTCHDPRTTLPRHIDLQSHIPLLSSTTAFLIRIAFQSQWSPLAQPPHRPDNILLTNDTSYIHNASSMTCIYICI